MILFFSGGSAIAETGIDDPAIMLSYYVTVKNGKPDKRLRRILDIRKRSKTNVESHTDRFWSKVDRKGPADCWNWKFGTDNNGYGVHGGRQGTVRAHRFSMQLFLGRPLKIEECVLHKCDNPPCCNPAHLFIGTRADNIKDMVLKGRNTHGEKHPWSKLTNEKVIDIVNRLARGEKQTDIAKIHGVSQSKISNINSRKDWKHLTTKAARTGKKPIRVKVRKCPQ